MKQRVITGILIALFSAPFIIFGTHSMAIFVLLLLIAGCFELIDLKRKAKQEKLPLYVFIISLVSGFLLIFDIPYLSSYAFNYADGILLNYGFNSLWIVLFSITMLTSAVFDKRITVIDSLYVFASILFLSLGLKGMLYVRSLGGTENVFGGCLVILYVLIVTCFTDMFAYFGGMTCYKFLGNEKVHKLNERISPKKTIEGCLVGTVIATIGGLLFALLVLKENKVLVYPWYVYLILSLVVSLFGQIGDLIFSAIKRHFNVKDYSSLLPGHGGVLDRIDSLLINSMLTAIFLTVLTYIV